HANKLVVGSGGYGESATIWEFNTDGNTFTKVTTDYFGVSHEGGLEPQFIGSLTSSNGVLFASTGATGEGEYYPQLWRSQPLVINNDGDDDEGDNNTLPNNGDLNNDGIVDTEQDNV